MGFNRRRRESIEALMPRKKPLESAQAWYMEGEEGNWCCGKIRYVEAWWQCLPRPAWTLFCERWDWYMLLWGQHDSATVLEYLVCHVTDGLEPWEADGRRTGWSAILVAEAVNWSRNSESRTNRMESRGIIGMTWMELRHWNEHLGQSCVVTWRFQVQRSWRKWCPWWYRKQKWEDDESHIRRPILPVCGGGEAGGTGSSRIWKQILYNLKDNSELEILISQQSRG